MFGNKRLLLGRSLPLLGSKEFLSGKNFLLSIGRRRMTGGCQKKADTDLQARIMPVVNVFYWRNWNDAEFRISPAEHRRRYVLQ
ncbi:MAG: hypothetical protein ACTFAL_08540 [Candidatus Electronema sp. V4]|uniref:hypothetical protein n=1 Tax=Candidatus Electronema sp. V4 TaxID=3454756 RepID=UPI0040554CC4